MTSRRFRLSSTIRMLPLDMSVLSSAIASLLFDFNIHLLGLLDHLFSFFDLMFRLFKLQSRSFDFLFGTLDCLFRILGFVQHAHPDLRLFGPRAARETRDQPVK